MFKVLYSSFLVNFKIQNRNGFYIATIFMVIISIFLLSYIDPILKIRFLPFLIMVNIISSTGAFIAFLVLLEKQERSFYALLVTPVSNNQFLFSKIVSLVILALIEGVGLYIFTIADLSNIFRIVFAIIGLTILYSLCGYILALGYSNFNEIIFPFVGLMMLISANLFFQLLGYDSYLLLIFPGYGGFQLLVESISSTITVEHTILYSFHAIFWIICFYLLSQRVFNNFMYNLEV